MKRFLLFAYDSYYPCGGWHDLLGQFDTIEDIRRFLDKETYVFDHYHLIDIETSQIASEQQDINAYINTLRIQRRLS